MLPTTPTYDEPPNLDGQHFRITCVQHDGYLNIHEKMDCSKGYFPDNRHRAATHNMFWVMEVMVPIFGNYITNSSGRKVSVKDICERHILEDFSNRYIPSLQDYLEHLEMRPWMNNGRKGYPSSFELHRGKSENRSKKKDRSSKTGNESGNGVGQRKPLRFSD